MDRCDIIKNTFFNSICSQERACVEITKEIQQELQYIPITSTVDSRELE